MLRDLIDEEDLPVEYGGKGTSLKKEKEDSLISK